MSTSLRALTTAGLAGLVAASVAFWPFPVWFVFPLLAILIAVGWGQLLQLPDPMTINIIVGTAGLAMVLVAFLAPKADVPGLVLLTLAISLVSAYFSQMIRNPRPRLVEVISGIITGAAVQLGLVGWVLATRAQWHTNPNEWDPDNLGFGLVLPFALALAGAAILGTAVFQNWPGNPDAGRPIWHRGPSAVARPSALASLSTAAAVVSVAGFLPFLLARLLGV